jgi:propanol-preferring alcohol dehydrogenase
LSKPISLRRGGTLVFVALPADNQVQLPIFETVVNAITIKGSFLGNRVDLAETFELHASGKTRVEREMRRLEEVNQACDEVDSGKVKARLVFDLW